MAEFGAGAIAILKEAIETNPVLTAKGYDYKALAIELNKPISKDPPEFITVDKDLFSILRERLDDKQLDGLRAYCVAQGYIKEEDMEPESIEVITTKWEQLGFYPSVVEFHEIELMVKTIGKANVGG